MTITIQGIKAVQNYTAISKIINGFNNKLLQIIPIIAAIKTAHLEQTRIHYRLYIYEWLQVTNTYHKNKFLKT